MNVTSVSSIFSKMPFLWKSQVPGRINPAFTLFALSVTLVGVIILAVGKGAFPLHPAEVVTILLGHVGITLDVPVSSQQEAVLMTIRLPRVLLGLLAGASLAVSGASLQALFRNPLADPGLIGVSGGAALAVASLIVLGATTFQGLTQLLGVYTLPVGGFAGGMLTTFIIYAMARQEGRTSLIGMLLMGIAVNALAFAGIGLFSFFANDEQLRNITFWSFGSLGSANWRIVSAIGAPLIVVFVLLSRLGPGLNALLLGESEATHLGYNVQTLKRTIIVLTALCTGFIVATCGIIGFVALIAPHIIRIVCGPDNRVVIPGAALLGAILMILADLIARIAVTPAELPIGIVTALVGAPFFMVLLFKQRRTFFGE